MGPVEAPVIDLDRLGTLLQLVGVIFGAVTIFGPDRISGFTARVRGAWSRGGALHWCIQTWATVQAEVWIGFIAGRFKTSFGRKYDESYLRGWRLLFRGLFGLAMAASAFAIWLWSGPETHVLGRFGAAWFGSIIGSFAALALASAILAGAAILVLVAVVAVADPIARMLSVRFLYALGVVASLLAIVGGLSLQLVS